MKTIVDYIKEYGKYTFLEKEFNEVDNAVLSFLAYVDFYEIVPEIGKGSITLKEASNLFYKKHNKKEIKQNIISVRKSETYLKDIASSKRYKDLLLLNYSYNVSDDIQFGAMCVKLPDDTMYVSFEGTDSYISGWKEDFMMYSSFPLRAHKEAIKYLNKVVGLFGPRVYVGGHSKGGNLALVSSMYAKPYVRRKIMTIYSNDGPGLRLSELNSLRYKRIKDKYVHILPEESIVGILINNDDNYTIIKSKAKKLFQHDLTTWGIEDNKFVRGEMSQFTKRCMKALDNWTDKMDDEKIKRVVETLFEIFEKAEIEDILEIKKDKLRTLYKLYKEAKNIDKESEKLLSTCFKELYQEWRD